MKIRTRGYAYQSLAIDAIASDFSNYHLIERKGTFNQQLVDCPAELDGAARSAVEGGDRTSDQYTNKVLSSQIQFFCDGLYYLRPVPLQPVVKSFETSVGKSKTVQDIIAIPVSQGRQICFDHDYTCPESNCLLQFCDQLHESRHGETSSFDRREHERLSSPVPVQPRRLPQDATIPDNTKVVNNSKNSSKFNSNIIKQSRLKAIAVTMRCKESHKKGPRTDVLNDELEMSQHIIGKYFDFMKCHEEKLDSHAPTSQVSESECWLKLKKKEWLSQRIFLRVRFHVL